MNLKFNKNLSTREISSLNRKNEIEVICELSNFVPICVFNRNDNPVFLSIKENIVNTYLEPTKESIINFINYNFYFWNGTQKCIRRFIKYLLGKEEYFNLFKEWYNTSTTWDIANDLNVSQSSIAKSFKEFNITSKYRGCSKIHLQTKSIIEEYLGRSTITEKYLHGFRIDEFDELTRTCIEIDGEWCHNKEYDKIRDFKLFLNGYFVIRIPAYSSKDKIFEILRSSGL